MKNIDKIMISILSILLLTACGGNQAEVIDKEEIARIQEIDRMRGKALTEKVLAEREEKKLAQLEKEKKEQEQKEKEVKEQEQKEKELLVNDDPKPTTVISSAKEQSHEVPTQQTPVQPQIPVQPQAPVQPQTPSKEEKPVRLGELGNSGKEFKTFDEARNWAEYVFDDFEKWDHWEEKLGMEIGGYVILSVYWSNDTFTYSIQFKE